MTDGTANKRVVRALTVTFAASGAVFLCLLRRNTLIANFRISASRGTVEKLYLYSPFVFEAVVRSPCEARPMFTSLTLYPDQQALEVAMGTVGVDQPGSLLR
jgi:hypothetical protein